MRNSFKEERLVFESAARTATPTAATIVCGSLGGLFVIDVTAVAATPSVVFNIDGVVAGVEYTIIDSAAITATGTTIIRVHPSLTAAANTIAKDILPQAVKISPIHADADSITYTVTYVGVN